MLLSASEVATLWRYINQFIIIIIIIIKLVLCLTATLNRFTELTHMLNGYQKLKWQFNVIIIIILIVITTTTIITKADL